MKVIKLSQVKEKDNSSPLFTGPVTAQPIVTDDMSKLFSLQQVNFGKGVRNKLHVHEGDNVLIVTKGKGIVATDKEQFEVGVGDIVFVPAGEKNSHGAAPGSTYSHITLRVAGSKTTQLEK
jgi:quercetin dioxygenase-like cupin family protein